ALSVAEIKSRAQYLSLPFATLPVYHHIKFTTPDPYTTAGTVDSIVDSVHAQPVRSRSSGAVPGRFDTVLVNDGTGELTGVKGDINNNTGYRVAQVRVVFALPARASASIFPAGITPPRYLAYVEWFSPFASAPEAWHHFYKVKRSTKEGEHVAAVIPVSAIRRSVHLLPKFGPVAPAEWTSSNVLD
ncbi:hypothetical protein C8F01DRAFT_1345417, partial [Mycena amicta]